MKPPISRRQRACLWGALSAYVALVFAADLLTPLVYDVWVLYLPVILVPVWFANLRQITSTAGLCSMMMFVALILSGSGIRSASVSCLISWNGADRLMADGICRHYDQQMLSPIGTSANEHPK